MSSNTNTATTSALIATVIVKPLTPHTQAEVVTTTIQSDDENEAQNLISS